LLALFASLVEKWPFSRAMAAREMKSSNKGAVFGLGWVVVRPFVQVAVYVVIVTYVFGARLNPTAGPYDYALFALSGMFGWQILQRGLEDSTSLIRDRMEILKQVVYPIETLPVTTFLASAIGPAIVLLVYLVLAALGGKLSWTVVLLPIPLGLLLLSILGLSWIFMVVGVILKDLREIISVLLGLTIYLSPVLMSPMMVSPRIWDLILLNPLSHVIIAFRDVFEGTWHPISWGIFALGTVAALWIGSAVITRARMTINEYI
jgi:lipopolysaccharide transport system permease protein